MSLVLCFIRTGTKAIHKFKAQEAFSAGFKLDYLFWSTVHAGRTGAKDAGLDYGAIGALADAVHFAALPHFLPFHNREALPSRLTDSQSCQAARGKNDLAVPPRIPSSHLKL